MEKMLSSFEKNLYKRLDALQEQLDHIEIELQAVRKLSTNSSNNTVCIREELKSLKNWDPIQKAKDFVQEYMKNGHVEEKEIYRMAKERGISDAELQKAKKELGVQSSFKGYGKNSKAIWIFPKKA